MLAGCEEGAAVSPDGTAVEVSSRVASRSPSAAPPGAALPLSIGGRLESESDDPSDTAIHCAAALNLTARQLANLTDQEASREISLIQRAEAHFIKRAEQIARDDRGAVGSVEAAVTRRVEEKSAQVSQQGQLAIACLRRFGESANPRV